MGYAQPPDASSRSLRHGRRPAGFSGTSRTRVGGSHEGVHGPAIVVAVNAPLGTAKTEAARRALAQALGVPALSRWDRIGQPGQALPISNPPEDAAAGSARSAPPTVINGPVLDRPGRCRPVRGEKE